MGRVALLPDDLANQIAAGEVVERPASVVKELLENALDAGATRITVEVEGGGITLLRVTDNGVGMEQADAMLALQRHATSKIQTLDDLLALSSFGFRGEALPSIASVSRFVLRSRRREDDEGVEVRVEGGRGGPPAPCGLAVGTSVEVRDLFFNVPARRKFLKSQATESSHITETVEAMALSHPALSIDLLREGRRVAEWLSSKGTADRVRLAHKGEELAELGGQRPGLSVHAFLGRPERARAASHATRLFVNGRLIRDRALVRTVLQAYGSVLPPGRYPVGVVFLSVPGDQVDVNVHPQKAEVRFSRAREITEALFGILSLELGRAFGLAGPVGHLFRAYPPRAFPAREGGGLRGGAEAEKSTAGWSWDEGNRAVARENALEAVAAPLLAPRAEAGAPSLPPLTTRSREEESGSGPALTKTEIVGAVAAIDPWGLGDFDLPVPPGGPTARAAQSARATFPPAPTTYPALDAHSAGEDGRVRFSALRFLAQARSTYLICEGHDGLYVLDQHAAAERVTFHRLRMAFASRTVALQPLLFPQIVEATEREIALVAEHQDDLLAAGLDARAAGSKQIAIHGVPQIVARAEPERLLRDLLAEASRQGGRAFSATIDLALATMACHGSLRAGERIAAEEATALLEALDDVDFAGHCPHGRPVLTNLRFDELERKVGRR